MDRDECRQGTVDVTNCWPNGWCPDLLTNVMVALGVFAAILAVVIAVFLILRRWM